MKVAVTYAGGNTVTGVVGPRTRVEVERKYGISFLEAFKDKRIERIYFVAWGALHFAGQEETPFDDWLNKIDDVELLDDEEGEPDPTRLAPGPEPSSD